jgi:hypothetical protein
MDPVKTKAAIDPNDNKPTTKAAINNIAANNKTSIWGNKQPEAGLIDLSNKDQNTQQNPALNYRQLANSIAERIAGTIFGGNNAQIAPATSVLSNIIMSGFNLNQGGKKLSNSTDNTKTSTDDNSSDWNDIDEGESETATDKSKTAPKVSGNNPKLNQLGKFLENDDQINYQLGETKNLSPEKKKEVKDIDETIDTLPDNKKDVWSKVDESKFTDFKEGQTWTPSGFMNGYKSQEKALANAKKEYPDEAAYMTKINGGGANVPDSVTKNDNEDVIYNSNTKFKVGKKHDDQGYVELTPEENSGGNDINKATAKSSSKSEDTASSLNKENAPQSSQKKQTEAPYTSTKEDTTKNSSPKEDISGCNTKKEDVAGCSSKKETACNSKKEDTSGCSAKKETTTACNSKKEEGKPNTETNTSTTKSKEPDNKKLDQLGKFLENDDQINYQLETKKQSPEQKKQVEDLNKTIKTLPGNKGNVWTKVDENKFMDFKEGQTYTESGFMNGYTSQKNANINAKKEYPDEAAYMIRINSGGEKVPVSQTKNNNEDVIFSSNTKFKIGKKHEDQGYVEFTEI